MSEKILVINAGSSSIKWTLFHKNGFRVIANGIAERIGVDGSLDMKFYEGKKASKKANMPDHKTAVKEILKMWEEHSVVENADEIKNIGFRIVHGSTHFSQSVKLDDEAIDKVEEAGKFAPLHNPGAVQAIKSFKELMPHSKLSASFDTAFHTTIPAVNSTYPMNKQLADELGIKKYGMHGISHMFITKLMEEILEKDTVNFVNLHIGNGASICAIKDSKSFDTSMGLTPLAGIMMGTRSGDIDPSIHEFVMESKGISIKEFTDILNKKSGLKGVSGISSDMRDVIEKVEEGHADSQLAFDLYTQRITDVTAAYLNKIEHPEAIVFTAGVGENSIPVRKTVCEKLAFFGIKIDEEANNDRTFESYNLISTEDSKMKVYVVRTNEELMIARDAIMVNK